ncbi:hypothetical protein DSBG_0688 [Desulfosporosinus sp. BG]|nr:hypothetical protein DSBG_0688 [Desulfosporosinus sp. BG]
MGGTPRKVQQRDTADNGGQLSEAGGQNKLVLIRLQVSDD